MGDPKRIAERIPQLVWAIIKSTRHYYSMVCFKEDLDPEPGDPLRLPIATLEPYTFLLKAELPIEVDGIPEQWTPTHKRNNPATITTTAKPANKTDSQPKQQTQNPFKQSNTAGGTTHTYQNQPTVFTNNEILHEFKGKRGRVMRELMEKAGIPGGQNGLNLSALPANICLRYLLLGQCISTPPYECKRHHPHNEISKEGVDSLYKQLEPALKRMADRNKRQRTE